MLLFSSAALAFAIIVVVPIDPERPAKPDAKARALAVLDQWEKRVNETNSFIARDVVRTDKTNGMVKTWKGEMRYIRPNHFALRLILQEDPRIYELLVQNGNQLFDYVPQYQRLGIRDLPAENFDLLEFGQGLCLGNDVSWRAIFGLEPLPQLSFHDTVAKLKERSDLTVTRDISDGNPDYIYVAATPRKAEYRKQVVQLQLVFYAQTMQLRRLWFEQPNGTETTWDLPNIDTATKIKPADFEPPAVPKDWETVQYPAPKAEQRRP